MPRLAIRLSLLFGLAACTQPAPTTDTAPPDDPGVDPSDDGPAVQDPSEWTFDSSTDLNSDIDLNDVAQAIEDAIDIAHDMRIDPVIEAYNALMDQADNGCPSWTYAPDGDFWFDNCTSNDGVLFTGYTIILDDFTDLASYYTNEPTAVIGGEGLQSGCYIEDSDGSAFSIVGNIYNSWVFDSKLDVFFTSLKGQFGWEGNSAEGTWLGDGIDPDLTLTILDSTDPDAVTYADRQVEIDGALAALPGDFDTVIFDTVNIYDGLTRIEGDQIVPNCPTEPIGSIQIRRSDGVWYDIQLDTLADWAEDPAKCDGCVMVSLAGSEFGEVCLDFTKML
jgi:hypothetical protein